MTTEQNKASEVASKGWLGLKIAGFTSGLRRRWLRNRDVTIGEGVAKGLRFNAAVSNPEYSLGSNERPVQAAFAQHLHEGDVLYDIGANVGFFTLIGAKLVGPGGQVHAFEPVPENATAVRHNCEMNGMKQVVVWETAVSDQCGTGELQLAAYSGGASLSVTTAPPDFKGILQVELTTIDTLVSSHKLPPPAMVKVDVEGAEINVFQGMTATIQTHKPIIIFEIDDGDPEAFEKKRQICTDFLQKFGYQIELLPDSYPHAGWMVENYLALPT
ncbi:MAG: FkbM family methyltransferase [Chloroflexi bacterium]|nr:FkbM family methyltransferase [Chloroflexota bacterium]